MHGSNFTQSFRSALMLALGLSASAFVGAGGCAQRGGHGVCIDDSVDYATCSETLLSELAEPSLESPSIRIEEVCFDGSEGCEPCDIEEITGAAIGQTTRACDVYELERVVLGCGPDPDAADCCYLVRVEGDFACAQVGRPLLASAGQAPRVAALLRGRAWLAPALDLSQLHQASDPAARAALHRHWLSCARYEHASVAAFARVGLQLLSLGAPAQLLHAAQRAKGDEVRHAQLCFALAAAYGDAPAASAGPLSCEGLTAGMELEDLLREAIFEGALGEGTAVLEAREGAALCQDPVVRALLEQIAEDEQRHALLAYETLQWALAAHPQRAAAIIDACLREGHRHAPPAGQAQAHPEQELGRHGLITAHRRAALRHEVWHELVAPLLAAMRTRPRHPLIADQVEVWPGERASESRDG